MDEEYEKKKKKENCRLNQIDPFQSYFTKSSVNEVDRGTTLSLEIGFFFFLKELH